MYTPFGGFSLGYRMLSKAAQDLPKYWMTNTLANYLEGMRSSNECSGQVAPMFRLWHCFHVKR